jgi:predicted aspartyl protease
MTARAFVSEYEHLSSKLLTEVTVLCDDKTVKARALWDTGATGTCISKEIAVELGLTAIGKQQIHTPTGTDIVNTYRVDIILPNDVKVTGIQVCDSEIGSQNLGVLIGMDIIALGDFAVSNYNERTTFTFRTPSKKKTDYVAELRFENAIGQKHGKGKKKYRKK